MNTFVPKGVINMFVLTMKLNKKKSVFLVIMVALVLIGIILLASAYSKSRELDSMSEPGATERVKDEEDRINYLARYGWEVETPAVSNDTVVIPRTFSDIFEEYNELQIQQGFDLSQYCGLEVEIYTYRVLNHESEGEVLAQLYVRNNSVIGGDVHSTAIDGFMVPIKST